MPRIVSAVGMPGSGKSTVIELLARKRSFQVVYFGGVVMEELRVRGLQVTEDHEAAIRIELRRELGMAAMAIKSMPAIKQALAAGHDVLLDSIYSYAEYKLLEEAFPNMLDVIAVHAPKRLRYERLSSRPVRPLTPQQARERDRREIEELEKGGPIALADYHILNQGTSGSLDASVTQCLQQIFGTAPAFT